MPHYNFNEDYPIAKKTEEEVAILLEKVYGAEIVRFENTNKFDILARVRGTEITFEIKEDFICERTGNVGLEYECRGKPSGIQTTQADYYIYKLHTKHNGIQYVMHSTDNLKEMIRNEEYFLKVNGGDPGSNSMNYLFKYNVFVRRGKILPLDKIS